MKQVFAILTVSLVATVSLRAADAPPKMELKNKSTFEMENTSRNPFWPIGWKPAAQVSEPGADHAGPEIPTNAFLVSSITYQSSDRVAIINGRIMQEGQQFGLQMGNQTYQITVKAIEDGRVILARRDQEIVVSLRRK
ncbi:MAG: hypothetical protein ABI992_01275 [Chthoniobacterales bacterium]